MKRMSSADSEHCAGARSAAPGTAVEARVRATLRAPVARRMSQMSPAESVTTRWAAAARATPARRRCRRRPSMSSVPWPTSPSASSSPAPGRASRDVAGRPCAERGAPRRDRGGRLARRSGVDVFGRAIPLLREGAWIGTPTRDQDGVAAGRPLVRRRARQLRRRARLRRRTRVGRHRRLKSVWELSRHQFLVTLGCASWFRGAPPGTTKVCRRASMSRRLDRAWNPRRRGRELGESAGDRPAVHLVVVVDGRRFLLAGA